MKKLKVLPKEKVHIGCLTCSTVQWPKASMRTRIWGEHDLITKNGKTIYFSYAEEDYCKAPTLMIFENMARKEHNADWRYKKITGLHDEVYQRQGKNFWPIVKSGPGYA